MWESGAIEGLSYGIVTPLKSEVGVVELAGGQKTRTSQRDHFNLSQTHARADDAVTAGGADSCLRRAESVEHAAQHDRVIATDARSCAVRAE